MKKRIVYVISVQDLFKTGHWEAIAVFGSLTKARNAVQGSTLHKIESFIIGDWTKKKTLFNP